MSSELATISRCLAVIASAAVVLAAARPLRAQDAPLFDMPSNHVGEPQVIVAHDLDGDGRQDIVVANGNSATLNILLSRGNGSFADKSPVAIPAIRVDDVAVADFNGDGKSDLVVSQNWGLTVLRGFGNGAFSIIGTPLTGVGLAAVVAADFDEDGVMDIAAVDQTADTVRLLIGNGNGSFTPGLIAPVAADLVDLAVGDFDGNGHADLATIHGTHDLGTGSMGILLGDGTGGLSGTGSFPTVHEPGCLAVGDFNGDGRQDVVAGNDGTKLSVLFGHGDGTFQGAMLAVDGTADVVAADLDGDGCDDIATVNGWPPGALIYRGQPNGSFVDKQLLFAGISPTSLAAADFDGDGALDLSYGAGVQARLTFLRGHGDGTFVLNPFATITGLPEAVADFNEDGTPDLALTSYQAVTIALGQGGAAFVKLPPNALGLTVGSLVVARLDGDAHEDLALTVSGGNVLTLLGHGDGSFTNAGTSVTVAGNGTMRAGDLDGDGILDLAAASYNQKKVITLLGSGDGHFALVGTFDVGSAPRDLAVADFNGDGLADVAAASDASDKVALLLAQPDGSLVHVGDLTVSSKPTAIVSGDFDSDGKPDLATANEGSHTVAILQGQGGASFSLTQTLPVGGLPVGLLVADLDGDGVQDLVSTNKYQGTVTVLLGRGDGSFDVHGSFSADQYPGLSVVGDFDTDGRQDVLVSNGTMLLNRGGLPGFAWTNLGHQLAGVAGEPLLVGSGTLQTGSAGVLALSHALPAAPGALFLAPTSTPMPFKGGVLVPVPVILTLGLATDAAGAVTLPWSAWPAGLAGLSLHFQCAVADVAALQGVALSNALRADVP